MIVLLFITLNPMHQMLIRFTLFLLYRYARDIWTNIRAHKELNLPSQKEMLSTFRCEEFVHESFALYRNQSVKLLDMSRGG